MRTGLFIYLNFLLKQTTEQVFRCDLCLFNIMVIRNFVSSCQQNPRSRKKAQTVSNQVTFYRKRSTFIGSSKDKARMRHAANIGMCAAEDIIAFFKLI